MVFVALILAASAPADALPKARQAYASCLGEYTRGASAKMPAQEFVADMKAKCADKEAAFRSALLAADKADGMSDKDAAQDADDQISDYVSKMVEDHQNGE